MCAYLDNSLSIKKTSDALFMHRSMLIYQLNRIKEITGKAFDNPDKNFYLTCSTRIHRYKDTENVRD